MASISFRVLVTVAALACLSACEEWWPTDDDGGVIGTGSFSGAPVADICFRDCDAHDSVQGCSNLFDLEACKARCRDEVATLPSGCGDEFNAYYGCSSRTGFACIDGVVAQSAELCDGARQTLSACILGGGSVTAGSGSGTAGVGVSF